MNQTKELFTILGFFHNKDNILTTSLMEFLQGKSTTSNGVIWKDVYDYGINLGIIAQGEGELKNDTIRKIRSNQCNCEICIDTRVCLLNFNDYVPKDEFAQKFYDGIVTTCKKHNIYI